MLHQPELVVAPADADTADAEEEEIKEDEEVKDEDEGQKETQDCRCYKFFGICFLLFVAGVFCVFIVSSHFWRISGYMFLTGCSCPQGEQAFKPTVLNPTKMGLQTCGILKSQRRNRDPTEYENGLMKDIHPTSAQENLYFGGFEKKKTYLDRIG